MIYLDVPTLENLKWEPARYRFTVSGEWVPSVSKVTRQWSKPFDKDKWAAIIAKREKVSVEEIHARWEAKRDASVQLGEEVHTAIEHQLNPDVEEEVRMAHVCTMSRDAMDRLLAWEEKVLPRIRGPIFVNGRPGIELPVYHKEFMYAGLGDCFAETEAGIWVADWKTNGDYKTENKYGDKMLPPFDDLPSCEHSEYSIQGSLLRMALESHGVQIAGTFTAWLGSGGAVKIRVGIDLRDRLTEALRGAKK